MESLVTFNRPEPTRRDFLKIASTAAAAAVMAPYVHATRPQFAFPDGLPMLRTGEAITSLAPVEQLEFFKPLFGATRTTVNPVMPKVRDGRTLVFEGPGEYYLRANGSAVKAVVLSPDEGLTASLLRLFDFCVANNLHHSGDDYAWYSDRAGYLLRFFTSDQPSRLLCGPTHQFFRMIVEKRLGLPVRVASGAGTYFENGKIVQRVHNVPEVYVPEQGKWVFFDLNFGWMAQWMDAMEVAAATRQWGDVRTGSEQFRQAIPHVHQPMDVHPSTTAGEIAPAAITDAERALWLRAFYSGIGYWGVAASRIPSGTEFLGREYNAGNLHNDRELAGAAVGAVRKLGFETTLYQPASLRKRLDEHHADLIALKQWQSVFPSRA